MVGIAVIGPDGANVVAGAAVVGLHNLESADILPRMVCMMEFDTRSSLAPSPMKLPLKLAA